jgi:hypothetical protein
MWPLYCYQKSINSGWKGGQGRRRQRIFSASGRARLRCMDTTSLPSFSQLTRPGKKGQRFALLFFHGHSRRLCFTSFAASADAGGKTTGRRGSTLIPSIPKARTGETNCITTCPPARTGNDFIWVLGHFSPAVTSRLANGRRDKKEIDYTRPRLPLWSRGAPLKRWEYVGDCVTYFSSLWPFLFSTPFVLA